MANSNRSVLLQANAAVAKGDHEGFLAHCTDDVTWQFIGAQTLSGKDAVRAYMKETYVEPPSFTVDRLVAGEDHLTAMGEIELKDKSGKRVCYAYCDVWRLRDNKLAELRAYVVELKS